MPERAPLAAVHTLFEHNARQVPECMQALASQIASGEVPDVKRAVCVLEDSQGRMSIFFWGDLRATEMVGVLQRAQWKACRTLDEGDIPHEIVPAE
jgi:uncharacterized protein YbaA (DUF1428 family)